MNYSRGAFINLTSYDPVGWRRQLSHVDALEGLDHLELWLEFVPTRRELADMADLFADRHTIMHGPFIGTSVSSNWDALVQISLGRWGQALEAASYLGCRVLTFHAGAYGDVEPHADALERLAEHFAAFARSSDPIVTLENMPKRNGATREALAELDHIVALWERRPDASVTLDVGHCLQNGDDPTNFVRKYADRIANIHLHDGVCGGKGHLPLGSGELDLSALVEALLDVGYQKYVTLETLGREDTESSWTQWRDVEDQLRHSRGRRAELALEPQAA